MVNNKPKKKKKNLVKFCYFCMNQIPNIDYKDTDILGKFTSNYQRILPRKRMGSCARHQRQLTVAVKRARFMALLPYTNGQR